MGALASRRPALTLVTPATRPIHVSGMQNLPTAWPIAAFLDHLTVQGAATSTRKLRSSQLRRIARGLGMPFEHVTHAILVDYFAAQAWSADTRRSHYAAIRTFCTWALEEGIIDTDPTARLPRVRATIARPRPAGEDTITRALDTLDKRLWLMVRLGAYAGLRACEIATVHRDNLHRDLVGWSLRVTGKGGRVRDVPLDETTAHAIKQHPGWVFPGRIDGHLSPHYVSKLLSRHLANATGHQLRHRYASAAYARGGRDLLAVRDLLGHASVATTQIYTAIPDDATRTAALAAAA